MNSLPTMPVVEALSWTLIHFIWQGAVIALLFAIAKKGLKRRSANLRYLAACLGMLTMLALPLVTFLTLRYYSPSTSIATIDPHRLIQPSKPESFRADLADYLVLGGELSGSKATPPALDRRGRFSQLAPWLTSLWLAGVVLLSLRMLGGWLYARRLKTFLTGPLSEEWQMRFAQLRRNIRVLRPVRILESALVQVPTVIGWMRPVVLIPASALVGLTPSQLEAVVAHELAHIRRYDYLVNLLQTAVEIVLFYHPAIWWLSREIRQEREHCCDDVAVAVCGDALVYARALTEIEVLRNITPRLAMAADGGSLLARIQRILGNSPQGSDRTASWLAGAIVFVTVFVPAAGAQFFTHHAETVGQAAAANVSTTAQIDAPTSSTLAEPAPEVKSSDKQSEKNHPSEMAESRAESSENVPSIETPSVETPAVETPSVKTPSVETPRSQSAGGSFIEEMAALGYTNLSVDLIALRTFGVSAQLVRELKAYGYDKVSVKELTRLAAVGVTGQFIKDLKAAGIEQVPIESLARLAMHGVSPSLIKELADLGYKNLSADQLSQVAGHGVSPQFIRGLQSAGFKDLPLTEVVHARDHGVGAEFIKEIRERGYSSLALKDLIHMRDHGVDAEFLSSMEAGGFGHLPVEQMIRARDHGVDPGFAKQMHAAGFPNATLDQLVQMRDHGVSAAFVDSIRKSGLDNVTIEQFVRMRDHGVDAEFIGRAKSHGFQNLTIEQLIRLRDADVFN
jgi:beta-lactamase regulating signal transducer with metallopeptidase domain